MYYAYIYAQESFFALAQLMAIYPWGLSTRLLWTRRPVVLAGVVGLTITTLLFGLSRTFVTVVVTRALGKFTNFHIPEFVGNLVTDV